MAKSGINIVGHKELARALDKLPKEIANAAERTALREGAKPIAAAAKSNAGRSKETGLLQESIGVTVKKVRGRLSARVGARTGFGREVSRGGYGPRARTVYSDPSKYAHLVEYGTSKTAARPFMRPAIDSSAGEVVNNMAKGYAKGLDRAVRKLKTRK